MACIQLSGGRGIDCNRSSGGVKYIYFGVYDDFSPLPTVVDSEVTDIQMSTNVLYRYQPPRGTSQAMETITGSTDNGTIFYTPQVNMVLNRLSKLDQNQIKLLGQTQVIIFAQLNEQLANGHDVIIALGVTNAMQMNAGTADSGTALADRNGYTLSFDGFEADPFPVVEDYSTVPFDNAGFVMGTICTSNPC
tara:strand:+ start:296 stop:871 length:576 start_codon:yes stop_codon:yes gene_type:complete